MEANITTLTNERFLELVQAEKDKNSLTNGLCIIDEYDYCYDFFGQHREVREIRLILTDGVIAEIIEGSNCLHKEKARLQSRYDKLQEEYKKLQADYANKANKPWWKFWR